jgi:small subunit ribosomal protein S16
LKTETCRSTSPLQNKKGSKHNQESKCEREKERERKKERKIRIRIRVIMPVRIRLARFGQKNRPFYMIFVADSRAPRDGKHLEVVGHYDPIPSKDSHKHVGLHIDRIKYWLSVGAQPSDTVRRILSQAKIIPKAPTRGSAATALEK